MAEMQSNRNDDIFGRTDKEFGIPSIDSLALKYSKAQLQQMAQMGRIPPIYAVMAGMAQDRIQLNNSHAPETTVAQDTFGQQVADSSGQGITDSSGAAVGAGEPVAPQSTADISRAHGGLMSIPRPGEKYDQSNFATGGIVAFDAGGAVPEEQYQNPYYSEIAAQRASIPDTQAQALQAYYAGAPERAKARSKQDLNMNLIRLGANIGSQSGPFGMQNMLKGLAATAPNFAESLAGQRADEEAGIKGMADVEQKRRTEAIEGQKSAEGMYEKEQQYKAAAAKPTDFRSQVSNYVKAEKYKIANGQRKPVADELLFQEADEIIQKRIAEARMISAGASALGAQTGVTAAETGAQSAKTREKSDLIKSYHESAEAADKRLEIDRDYRQLLRKDPKAAAVMRENMISEDMKAKEAYVAANAISSDEIVAPVATKTPLAAKLPPLPKDIQKLVDKTYPPK
jgi:hypothetical protein